MADISVSGQVVHHANMKTLFLSDYNAEKDACGDLCLSNSQQIFIFQYADVILDYVYC